VFEVLEGRTALLLSTGLMLEYQDALTRPETLSRTGLSVSEVIAVLDVLAAICSPVASRGVRDRIKTKHVAQ
jgi:hypothetical protein